MTQEHKYAKGFSILFNIHIILCIVYWISMKIKRKQMKILLGNIIQIKINIGQWDVGKYYETFYVYMWRLGGNEGGDYKCRVRRIIKLKRFV